METFFNIMGCPFSSLAMGWLAEGQVMAELPKREGKLDIMGRVSLFRNARCRDSIRIKQGLSAKLEGGA